MLSRIVLSEGNERSRGAALPMVFLFIIIAVILVVAVATTLTSTITQSRNSRDSVRAQAAAEAGIDDAFSSYLKILVDGKSIGDTVTLPAQGEKIVDQNTADLSFYVTCEDGCGTQTLNESSKITLRSTGYAKQWSEPRPSAGVNDRTVEAEIGLKADATGGGGGTGGGSWEPAIYGSSGASGAFSSKVTLAGASGTPSFVYKGDFQCHSGMDIRGNLFITGDLTLSHGDCKVDGDIWVGGNMTVHNPGTFKTVNVVNNLTLNNLLTISNRLNVGGTCSTWWCDQTQNANPGKVSFGNPSAVAAKPTVLDSSIPKLTESSDFFKGFSKRNWLSDLSPKVWGGDAGCTDGGASQQGKTLKITSKTMYDTTAQCAGGINIGNSLTIELHDDLAILATNITTADNFTIRSGDSKDHKVYWVIPSNGTDNCSEGASGITVGNGVSWNQDSKTPILFYSANKPFRLNVNTPTLYGQIIACKVQTDTQFNLQYTPLFAGDNSGNPVSPGGGSTTPSVTLTSPKTRDVAN